MTEVVYRLYETVDELTTVIENARSVPMSASCMVPRDHLLDLLDDLRESLPEDVQAAGAIVEQRTEILQQAQAEAERLITETEVYRGAVSRADELGAQAHAAAAHTRAEVDQYVDSRLADFESTLEHMLHSVEKARTTLRE